MGLSYNVGSTGTDYSSLFSSMGSSSGNWLADYATIKNGSYGKLMKAYYAEAKSSSSGTTSTGKKSNSSNVLDKILEEKRNPKVSKEAHKASSELTTGLSYLRNSVSA